MGQIDIVRAAYDAWNTGDVTSLREHIHPDVEWHTSGVFPGMQGLYHGHEGVLQYQKDLAAPFDRFVVTIVEAREEGNVLTVRVHFDAVGAGSGARVELEAINVWHFRDGLIVRFAPAPVD